MKQFYDTLKELRGGATAAELADALAQLVAQVRSTRAAGKLTLVLTLKPVKSAGAFELIDEIQLKLPRPDRMSSLFFATADNSLSKNDPSQGELPFRVVPSPTPESVDRETGEITGAAT